MTPDGTGHPRRAILLAGPSGSGKSTMVRCVGLPILNLDDFYKAGSDPGLPRGPRSGIVDWDHPDSWDQPGALAAVDALCQSGRAQVPVYDIATDGRVGTREVVTGDSDFVAEGVFAPVLVADLHDRGLLLDAIVVRRGPWKNLVRRALRDLKEHRKPPRTIFRRGLRPFRVETSVVGRAMGAACRPLSAAQARAALKAHRASRSGAALPGTRFCG